ncbi:MAG: NADPH-dependent glutamate synthase [Bacilli bacterium]
MTNMNRENMKCQDPLIRITNFDEVALGYTYEQAMNEASRCLQCKKPLCVSGCPVNINIPKFIKEILDNNLENALQTINEANLFPSICGRVCPQESQCEALCVLNKKSTSVAIGNLERFVGDNSTFKMVELKEEIAKKVAIIGSGPSGLACAYELKKMGYDVTIFEALHITGGVLAYGIPEFRLPKKLVQDEVDKLVKIGVKIKTNYVVGQTITIKQLEEDGFQAFYIASGAGLPKFMGIPGENLIGVFSANEYLTRINLMKAYQNTSQTPMYNSKNVVVIGGGNVAMDAARSAKRSGAENVYVVYRRKKEDMPARVEEIHHALEEGIEFFFASNPIAIHKDDNNKVNGIECITMDLSTIDEFGRNNPIPIANSNFNIQCDTVIMALGNHPNPIIKKNLTNLEVNKNGTIIVNEKQQTSISNIFAGGDIVTGAATVILAMGAGKTASIAIDEYLKNK